MAKLWENYGLVLAVLAQATTILITWPTWNVRTDPPNLPLLDMPPFSMGWLMLASLALPFFLRRSGSWIHLVILIAAGCADQFRVQPQFYFGWLFVWYTSSIRPKPATGESNASPSSTHWAEEFTRWTLASLWLWSGIHKLLSPEWFGPRSYHFLQQMGLVSPGTLDSASQWCFLFALLIGVSEVSLGLLALVKPRWAAYACIPLHLGIVFSLLLANWNFSVLTWNLMCACCGFVIFRSDRIKLIPKQPSVQCLAVVLLVMPSLFYLGWVDRAFSFVLYSGMTPRGTISHFEPGVDVAKPRIESILGWNQPGKSPLAVPFPREHRCLKKYFELTANPGSKLAIYDPRPWVDDEYCLRTHDGLAEISKLEFHAMGLNQIRGIAGDDSLSDFHLQLAQVRRLARSEQEMVYAIAFTPQNYSRDLLPYLAGFPNLEQINFANCRLTNDDLKHLSGLVRLKGLGLSGTLVSREGLQHLSGLPELSVIEFQGSQLTQEDIDLFFQ